MTIAEKKLAIFRHIDKLSTAELDTLYNKLVGKHKTNMREAVSFSDVKRRFDVVANVNDDQLQSLTF